MSAKLSRCASIPPPPSNCSILAEALKNCQILNLQLLQLSVAILTFAENLLDFRLLNPWADVRTTIEHLQQEFWRDPSVKEAHAWSNFPLEDGWGKHSEARGLSIS